MHVHSFGTTLKGYGALLFLEGQKENFHIFFFVREISCMFMLRNMSGI